MWGEGRGEWMCGRGEGVRCVDVLEGRGQAKWVCGRGEGTGWVVWSLSPPVSSVGCDMCVQ